MGDREAMGQPVRLDQPDEAPVGEIGHGQMRHFCKHGAVVERGGQHATRFGQELLLAEHALERTDIVEGDDRARDREHRAKGWS